MLNNGLKRYIQVITPGRLKCEKRVFTCIITDPEMRSLWAPNPMTGILIRREMTM